MHENFKCRHFMVEFFQTFYEVIYHANNGEQNNILLITPSL